MCVTPLRGTAGKMICWQNDEGIFPIADFAISRIRFAFHAPIILPFNDFAHFAIQ